MRNKVVVTQWAIPNLFEQEYYINYVLLQPISRLYKII